MPIMDTHNAPRPAARGTFRLPSTPRAPWLRPRTTPSAPPSRPFNGRAGPGRPPIAGAALVYKPVGLTDAVWTMLAASARAQGISRAELIRRKLAEPDPSPFTEPLP